MHKYKLQDAIGLRDQKQRWLSYLDMMRERLYEKNVDFALSYRIQKTLVTSQVVRAFKKKASDFPVTAVQEEVAKEVQEKAAQEVQEEVVWQEETRRTQEESPVLPLQ
ncbi:unnamed protein product [Rhizophagus irregularis]|nr:unnamed protein product [Rhizophagus irregularis]